MLRCDVTDKLKDKYRLTYTGTSEQTDLTASAERYEKVNNLDTCLEDLSCGILICK